MKKNTAFNLFIITALAALFRFSFIDKAEGLWNDELTGVFTASVNNLSLFTEKVFENCHTPLYYIYLKLWLLLCPDTDISLRISSVIPSLAAIPVMFFAGKELKDEKTGYLAAFLTAISSYCIYFAQEVRLYSLIFLFSALTGLYFLKAIKVQNKINNILFFTFQALLCSLHTLGIIFCFFMTAAYLHLYLKNEKPEKLKNLILPFGILFVIIAILFPLLYKIAFSGMYAQFWSTFSFAKVVYNFIDYFSPLQLNISNSPSSLKSEFIKQGSVNHNFIIFGIIPMITGILALIQALRQKTVYNFLFYSCFGFYALLVFFALSGKIVLSTKYSSEIYPFIILGSALGFLSVKNEFLKKSIIILFAGLNLFFLLFSNEAAYKLPRKEGHKAVADLIKEAGLKNTDIVLLTYYDENRFSRYLDKNSFNFKTINKFNFNYFMFDNPDFKTVLNDGKKLYKDSFQTLPDENLTNYMNNFILYKTVTGSKVAVIYLNSVSMYNEKEMNEILSNKKLYDKTPFIFLVFSSLRNNIDFYMNEKFCFNLVEEKQKGDWTIKVWERTY